MSLANNEMQSVLELADILETSEENPVARDVLMHYGMPRRSGRYPWGSGEDPYQHGSRDFLGRVEELKKAGWTETPENIMKEFGLNTTQYRIEKKICKDQRRKTNVDRAKSLRDDGLGASEIGRIMGVRESTVRSWFNEDSEARMNTAKNTAEFLKKMVDEKGMIDVGAGVNLELNISNEQLNTALYLLEREGYHTFGGRQPQVTNPSQKTTLKVLCPPDTPYKVGKDGKLVSNAIYDYENVHTVKDYISRDAGESYEKKFHYPESMSSKRLQIAYAEDGGLQKDGLVEIRRNVPDLSLGARHYAQVRILVDGDRYIKGMAVYSDDLPPGVDVRFNTNKKRGTPMRDVLKPIKNDPDNPFGSAIKDVDQGGQYWYTDPKTGKKKLGLINKRADEGDWSDWKDTLPSQFLSKQSLDLAEKQLGIAKANKRKEYEEIQSLTNPTVKKHLLQKFADSCDSAAVELKAAALPGQKYQVIIPIPALKENEIYAPRYKNGTELALIRYPHGGTFEIPIVTVNNKHPVAEKVLGPDFLDAVGINSKVAERLSGADFDGDTVMCIPTHSKGGKVHIIHTPKLEQLEGFDPKMQYGPESYKGKTIKFMKDPDTGVDATQMEMGKISNLISDMTLMGANTDELARAVKHSMVVIDAAKHHLNYKQSEIDNNIQELKDTYQVKYDKNGHLRTGGASTIISKAGGQAQIDRRQGQPKINQKGKEWYDPSRPEGALIYKTSSDLFYPLKKVDKDTGEVTIRTTAGKSIKYNVEDRGAVEKYTPVKHIAPDGTVSYTDKSGGIQYMMGRHHQKTTQMDTVDDAYALVSAKRHPMELLYADYANDMKSLANKARLEMVNTPDRSYDRNSRKMYEKEVKSLETKLKGAEINSPRERAANRMAAVSVAAKVKANPTMSKSDIKKANQQAIERARQEVGSRNRRTRNINITDREWEAIQSGAVSSNMLKRILDNSDIDRLRELATPKTKVVLTPARISQIKALSATYTISEIADKLGLSQSTVSNALKGGKK